MNNSQIRALAALAAVMVSVMSCASVNFSNIPQKKTSDDCLVLIRTTLENADNSPNVREFFIQFNLGYPTKKLLCNEKEGYTAVLIRDPGVKIVKITSSLASGSNMVGSSSAYETYYDLPYEPGQVVVADYGFSLVLRKKSSSEYTSSYNFNEITDVEKAKTIEIFRKLKQSSWWM